MSANSKRNEMSSGGLSELRVNCVKQQKLASVVTMSFKFSLRPPTKEVIDFFFV